MWSEEKRLQMNDILIPSTSSHYMSSQSGSIQDLSACSGHSSSTFGGSEPEPNSSSRQDFIPPPTLPSDNLMGLRYMNIPPDDSRFSPDSGSSHSPVYSIEPPPMNTPSSSTTLTFQFPHVYQPSSLNGTTFSSAGNPYFAPGGSVYMPDIKPRINSIHSTGMAPPSRSPNNFPHPGSPISTRESYTSATPHLRRPSDLLSRSPPGSTSRGSPLSPSSSNGFTSPTSMGEPGHGGQAGPPLEPTESHHTLQTSDGTAVRPELFGRIDKGFFLADNDWTCYRRNYFSLNCSFTLHPLVSASTVLLVHQNGTSMQIYDFGLCIAAVVDGRDGKPIELVQHTPKRDKGPQEKPKRVTVTPKPHVTHGLYGSDNGFGSSRSIYDQGFGQAQGGPQHEACFERIQFKNATANNGKRRAAQQYYHLLIELFADVGQQAPERWIKVASRMSAAMVVRGRSPGHYQNERRGSNGSGGAGGSGGGSGYATAGSSLTGGSLGLAGTSSSLVGGSNYGSSHHHHHPHHHQYRATTGPLQIPMEPVISAEEAKGIEEPNCYMYYPGSIWDNANGQAHDGRYHLPSLPEYAGHHHGKIKSEYGGHHHHGGGHGGSGFVLPSLTSTHHQQQHHHQEGYGGAFGGGRHCGRWEGQHESKGFFPPTVMQQELNMT